MKLALPLVLFLLAGCGGRLAPVRYDVLSPPGHPMVITGRPPPPTGRR